MTNEQRLAKEMWDLLDAVSTVIIGKRDVLDRVATVILANGHVLLEDFPGTAKTLMVKSFAEALGLTYNRVQFTPDLLPADVTGTFVYRMQEGTFTLRKGPVFANVLLADEINRAPPKTQSALLEAMQERQVTIEGETHPLPKPFFVFATQNPIELEGTYPLPEAQLDRFTARIRVGYPSPQHELEMLRRRERRGADETRVPQMLTADRLAALQAAAEKVRLDDDIKEYVVRLVNATRREPRVALGASPRASLALYKLAKAHAFLQGRSFAIPDDVKTVAPMVLTHRLILHGESRFRGADPDEILQDVMQSVRAPVVEAAARPPGNGRTPPERP